MTIKNLLYLAIGFFIVSFFIYQLNLNIDINEKLNQKYAGTHCLYSKIPVKIIKFSGWYNKANISVINPITLNDVNDVWVDFHQLKGCHHA